MKKKLLAQLNCSRFIELYIEFFFQNAYDRPVINGQDFISFCIKLIRIERVEMEEQQQQIIDFNLSFMFTDKKCTASPR